MFLLLTLNMPFGKQATSNEIAWNSYIYEICETEILILYRIKNSKTNQKKTIDNEGNFWESEFENLTPFRHLLKDVM